MITPMIRFIGFGANDGHFCIDDGCRDEKCLRDPVTTRRNLSLSPSAVPSARVLLRKGTKLWCTAESREGMWARHPLTLQVPTI